MTTLVVAALVSLLATGPVRTFMLRHAVLDVPNHRSSHQVVTPRGGGLACATGALAASAFASVTGSDVPWLLLGFAFALAALGYLDDRRSLPAQLRLAVQVLVGACVGVVIGGGWLIAVGILLIPAVVNSVNFMDGINGITGLTMVVWGVAALGVGSVHGIDELVVIGGVTAGCAVGFLPANIPTARLFLGDSGSYLFGGLVAAGLVVGGSRGAPVAVLVAPLALYALDTMSTLARRACRRASILHAHRDHVYQRVTHQCALPHVVVAGTIALAAAAVTACWALWPTVPATILTLLVCAAYLAAPRILGARADHSMEVG